MRKREAQGLKVLTAGAKNILEGPGRAWGRGRDAGGEGHPPCPQAALCAWGLLDSGPLGPPG